MKKRFLSIILTLAMLMSVAGTAAASEIDIVPYASDYLDQYVVVLAAKGNGRMVISVSVDGVGKQDKIGVLSVDIEKRLVVLGYITIRSIPQHTQSFKLTTHMITMAKLNFMARLE